MYCSWPSTLSAKSRSSPSSFDLLAWNMNRWESWISFLTLPKAF